MYSIAARKELLPAVDVQNDFTVGTLLSNVWKELMVMLGMKKSPKRAPLALRHSLPRHWLPISHIIVRRHRETAISNTNRNNA